MRQYQHRKIGDIFTLGKGKEMRRFIKTENGIIRYSIWLAQQNPNICGIWTNKCEVHHKDFNRLNDTPENLICLTPEQHHKLHTKQVVGYYKENIIGVFDSLSEASKKTGCNISSISHYCKYQTPISKTWADYQWKYLDDYLAEWLEEYQNTSQLVRN